MKHAAIGPIAVHLPERVETNDDLKKQYSGWDLDLIYSKTGIRQRHVAAPDETASDLGVKAAEKLFAEQGVARDSIDFLLYCTQSPDYVLPTTACLMQHRLGLPTHVGALDFNLGCSGFVYGLGIANAMIQSGAARRVLLITAETYSRYIDPEDRSLRTIFGDGAAATLVEASETPGLAGFSYGTDGSGADMLFVNQGGARPADQMITPRKRQRWKSSLYMDGPGLVCFTIESIPRLVEIVLDKTRWPAETVDYYLMHQATLHMLKQLREHMRIDEARMPMVLDHCGNTVSSTIPILIDAMRRDGRIRPGTRSVVIGFGVGLSWAGCAWTEAVARE